MKYTHPIVISCICTCVSASISSRAAPALSTPVALSLTYFPSVFARSELKKSISIHLCKKKKHKNFVFHKTKNIISDYEKLKKDCNYSFFLFKMIMVKKR